MLLLLPCLVALLIAALCYYNRIQSDRDQLVEGEQTLLAVVGQSLKTHCRHDMTSTVTRSPDTPPAGDKEMAGPPDCYGQVLQQLMVPPLAAGFRQLMVLPGEQDVVITASGTASGELLAATGVPPEFPPLLSAVRTAMKTAPVGHLYREGRISVYTSFPHQTEAGREELVGLVSFIEPQVLTEKQTNYLLFLLTVLAILALPALFITGLIASRRVREREQAVRQESDRRNYLHQLKGELDSSTAELTRAKQALCSKEDEQVEIEQQIAKSNTLVTSILENLDGIIYVSHLETHEILFANTYLKKLFGFDPTGKKCWQFLHSNDGESCRHCLTTDLLDEKGQPSGPSVWEYQNPYDKKWYSAREQIIRWVNGEYVRLEVAMDITQHKEMEMFLNEARKQAEFATNTKDKFVALVAHDLKSPFLSILSMLKRILRKETFTHEVHALFLENIIKNGHLMLEMIDNLLAIDRLQTGRMNPELSFFDVGEMVGEVLNNFQHLAKEKKLTLKSTVPPGVEIYADKYLYFVVLNNLVSNAVKFSLAGGRVTVFCIHDDRIFSLGVKDTGRGIDENMLADLFKADVRTTMPGTDGEKGTGLGLIFCQDIIKAHGGTIRVESTLSKGTIFYVDLPRVCKFPELESS